MNPIVSSSSIKFCRVEFTMLYSSDCMSPYVSENARIGLWVSPLSVVRLEIKGQQLLPRRSNTNPSSIALSNHTATHQSRDQRTRSKGREIGMCTVLRTSKAAPRNNKGVIERDEGALAFDAIAQGAAVRPASERAPVSVHNCRPAAHERVGYGVVSLEERGECGGTVGRERLGNQLETLACLCTCMRTREHVNEGV